MYHKISNIRRTKYQKLKWFPSHVAVAFDQSIEARCWVENEDVVGAAPTGDAPTTCEWLTILLTTKVGYILETWRYLCFGDAEDGTGFSLLWIFPLMLIKQSILYTFCRLYDDDNNSNNDSNNDNDDDNDNDNDYDNNTVSITWLNNLCFTWLIFRHMFSPLSDGVSYVNICEKIDRVITALHCIGDHFIWIWLT